MAHIAKNTKLLPLLKQRPKIRKNPKPVLLDNKRISKLLGTKPENIKNTLLPMIFQRVSSQPISIGEMSRELILHPNIEIKDIVAPATLFLSLKSLSNV